MKPLFSYVLSIYRIYSAILHVELKGFLSRFNKLVVNIDTFSLYGNIGNNIKISALQNNTAAALLELKYLDNINEMIKIRLANIQDENQLKDINNAQLMVDKIIICLNNEINKLQQEFNSFKKQNEVIND